MNLFDLGKKESRINKSFWILSCVILFAFVRFEPEELFIALECLLIVVRYFMVRELREQRKAMVREAEVQSAKNIRAEALKREEEHRKALQLKREADEHRERRARGKSRLEKEREAFEAQQKKRLEKELVANQGQNSVESDDLKTSLSSTEQVAQETVPTIRCASDIVKARSVSFSRRAPGNEFGLAEEMSKVGYRTVGDLYSDIEKIITREVEVAAVVGKFDVVANNDYLRLILTRLLYAAALGLKKPEYSDLKPLALSLRTIVESQRIVPRARDDKSSHEIAEWCSAVVAIAVAACQHGSASALMERLDDATLLFADERISPDGPSTRRYVTALILCILTMVLETSESVSIVTDSLAGNRLIPLDVNKLGSIDFNYLNLRRPAWLTEVISSPEFQRAYLRHLRDDD